MTLHPWRRNSVQSEYHYPGRQYKVNLQAIILCGYYLIPEHGLLQYPVLLPSSLSWSLQFLPFYLLHSPDHHNSYPSASFSFLTFTSSFTHTLSQVFSFPFSSYFHEHKFSWWFRFRDWRDVRMRGLKDGEQGESQFKYAGAWRTILDAFNAHTRRACTRLRHAIQIWTASASVQLRL